MGLGQEGGAKTATLMKTRQIQMASIREAAAAAAMMEMQMMRVTATTMMKRRASRLFIRAFKFARSAGGTDVDWT